MHKVGKPSGNWLCRKVCRERDGRPAGGPRWWGESPTVSPVAERQNAKKLAQRKQPRQAEGSTPVSAGTGRPMSVEAILQLQAFAGNAAVAELLERQSRPRVEPPSPSDAAETRPPQSSGAP